MLLGPVALGLLYDHPDSILGEGQHAKFMMTFIVILTQFHFISLRATLAAGAVPPP